MKLCLAFFDLLRREPSCPRRIEPLVKVRELFGPAEIGRLPHAGTRLVVTPPPAVQFGSELSGGQLPETVDIYP